MSALREAIEGGRFAVTAEIAPPKGADFTDKLATAELLRGKVHGLNVTDMQGASLRASSFGFCVALKLAGHDPIVQATGRDRSRMAIMGDLLGAAAFGIDTMLAVTGDHTLLGDCKASKPVYDLDSVGILRMMSEMEATGCDCGGNPLTGPAPHYYKGAIVTPLYEPLFLQLNKLRKKVDCGAQYIQTQALYDIDSLRRFIDAMGAFGIDVPILVGVIPLKSARMAHFMNENVPGISVPQSMIDQLEAAAQEGKVRGVKGLPGKLGLDMAAEFVARVKDEGLCSGVHIMTVGAEQNVPVVLEKAGIDITDDRKDAL